MTRDPSAHQSSSDQRVAMLEAEVDRLRRQLSSVSGVTEDLPAWFDIVEFRQVIKRTSLKLALLWVIAGPLLVLGTLDMVLPTNLLGPFSAMRLGPIPVLDISGSATGIPGIGLGLIAFGGMAVGGLAVGGGAIGIIAIGGGACGIIAYGGGAVGVIAAGGGSFGYIAFGGSACGRYALGERAYGIAALGVNRQDEAAIEFFRRWVPGLDRAVTTPMEVIPAEPG